MIEHHEISSERVGHHAPGLTHHQHRADVVPDTVGVGAHVDESVERTAGHRTDVERGGAHGPELAPAVVVPGKSADGDHGIVERGSRGDLDRLTVELRSPTADRRVASTRRQVGHHGDAGSVLDHQAERCGTPREPEAGVCGTVQGVDDDRAPRGRCAGRVLEPTLLGENRVTGREQRTDAGLVDVEIDQILPATPPRLTPVGRRSQYVRRRVADRIEEIDHGIDGEGRRHRPRRYLPERRGVTDRCRYGPPLARGIVDGGSVRSAWQ